MYKESEKKQLDSKKADLPEEEVYPKVEDRKKKHSYTGSDCLDDPFFTTGFLDDDPLDNAEDDDDGYDWW